MVIDQVQLVVPFLGESITEAVVARWLKNVGDAVAADEPVADLETDKVNVQVMAPAAGVLTEQAVPEGTSVKVGDPIGKLAARPEAGAEPVRPPVPPPVRVAPTPTAPVVQVQTGVHAVVGGAGTPGAAPGATPGPGPTPREPVVRLPPSKRRALRARSSAAGPAEAPGIPEAPPAGETGLQAPRSPQATLLGVSPRPEDDGRLEEVVPMTPLRKRIAERLVAAQHAAATLTTFNEIDMTRVLQLRERFGEEFRAKHGQKLGLMSFFARACVETLPEFPGLNAEVRGDAIVYKRFYDIGIAVGSGRGLVVPVIRDADAMTFAELEHAIAEYARKAKESRLTLDDLAGGSFTITNGGVYGSMMSTPLLNPPQTGILGMHAILRRPVAVDGDRIEIRPMMYVAVTYDHRVVDGRESVQFLVALKHRIEDPERLLVGV